MATPLTPQFSAYPELLNSIASIFKNGRQEAVRAVHKQLLQTYWHIGQHIVEYEQGGADRATYGARLLKQLAKDLSKAYGKGFSYSNVYRFRQFYLAYPIFAPLAQKLSWTHVVELLKIEDPLERGFYEKQTVREGWSKRELIRQKNTNLFLRIAVGKDKEEILKLSSQGNIVERPEDLLRDSYVFEFLGIPEPYSPSENVLEEALYQHLQQFLLELGKGFTFVGRQYRITLANRHYHVDLVFYHRILRCFVLIDLKTAELQHADIGQMNMYLGYFAAEENEPEDNPPIGIILTRDGDELMVEYATYGMESQLFAQKYQLYLPSREQLAAFLRSELDKL